MSKLVTALITILLVTTGCEKEGPQKDSDPFFTFWYESAGNRHFNMTDGHYGQFDVTYFSNGKRCECSLLVSGFTDHGDLQIRMCSFEGYTSHPDCDSLNEEYIYEYDGQSLRVCDPNGNNCASFQRQ